MHPISCAGFSTCPLFGCMKSTKTDATVKTIYSAQIHKPYSTTNMALDDSQLQPIGDISTAAISEPVVFEPAVFEPVVNVPALSSFLIIAVGFGLLQSRINAIGQAVSRREKALNDLRSTKCREISSDGEDRPSSEDVTASLTEYENALLYEEKMRTIIPGVRIRAPNNAMNNEEDVAAAKQFLDLDLKSGEQKEVSEQQEGNGMSSGAIAVLAIVALSQIALLYMLSFDPMAPPSGLSTSTW
mmetsp:Transcript_3304/g.4830  ORF Transcript_3304/g.4830 Transcript_3304/m.4830 type:complete len:243 (+) Transcript_3304:35-763(+)